jgi:hypothetical protein
LYLFLVLVVQNNICTVKKRRKHPLKEEEQNSHHLIFREIQINGLNFTPGKMAAIRKTEVGWGWRGYTLLLKYSHYGKQYGDSSRIIEIPSDPECSLLGICAKEIKAVWRRDTCTPIFITALCTTAKKWKQSKHLSTDDMPVLNGILCNHTK